MGYELRRQLADTLPDGLSSGERLVALELADQANDRTRLAFGHNLLALVARRCGFANEKQVGKVLGKLARRGIEFRVQVVRDGVPLVDRLGRPVFAFDGRETTYRIPVFGEPAAPPPAEDSPPVVPPAGDHPPQDRTREVSRSGDLSVVVVSQPGEHFSTGNPETTPSGPPVGTPQNVSGPPPGSQWSPAGVPVVPPAGDPSPHFPSGTPQVSRRTAREVEAYRWLAANYGLTDAEATQVIEQVRARGPRRIDNLVRYMAPMVTEGTLADIVAAIQTAGRGALADEPEPAPEPESEPPPLHALPGGASSSASTATQPSLFIRAVPDEQPEDEPERTPLPFYEPDGEDQRTAAPLLEELRRKWQADREAAAPDQTG